MSLRMVRWTFLFAAELKKPHKNTNISNKIIQRGSGHQRVLVS